MSKSMNRRAFLAGTMLLGAYGGLALAGCAPKTGDSQSPPSGKDSWMAGTYQADVVGHNAPFTVDVSFSETEIIGIDISSALETIGVGAYALDKISEMVMQYQSFEVDGLTGATLSSMSLQQGLKECAEQAGALTDLKANKGPEYEVETEYTADVCVVGGGGGGLAAAISAAQEGAKVVVLEKCGIPGGSTNVSEGALNAVDPERQSKQGIEDSVETFYTKTIEGGNNEGDPTLVHYMTDNALDSVHWLESLGVKFKDEVGSATGSLGERSHYPATPSGNTYIRSFEEYIEENPDKITFLDETQVESLAIKEGKVIGATAVYKNEQKVVVNAKAVIIATGGFGANVDYRQKVNTGVWNSVKLDDSIGCTNIKPCAQGEGLQLAEEAGAELVGLPDIQLHPCGTPGTGLMENIRTSGRNRIFVNKEGARFVNEGAKRDELCEAIFAQPESTYWIVVNKVRYPSETEPDANGSTIENMLALGSVVAGDTLDELAEKTGMEAAKLKAAIDGYNAVIEGSATDEFGFEAGNTADTQLTEGPWYACQKVPTVHHTMGGIRIDETGQALDAQGKAVQGLYACGECTGGIHGSNRLGGNAIADIMTFGRSAGVHAAKEALS